MRKWLPYAPPDEHVWASLHHMAPSRSGSYHPGNIFTVQVAAGPASPGTTLRAWCALLPDDSVKGFVGTTTKVYEFDGSTFTDRSKGGGYTNTATDWSFAQYGNITLATNRADNIQVRDSSGSSAFADASGSPPKARILVSQAEQILAFDLNDGAEKPDAFATCAPGDYTDWSSAGATLATRIRHRPGKITAAIAFREYVLAFKKSSVYKLTYSGSTFKWRVECIGIGMGAQDMHAVVNCGDTVVFHGPGGAWRFDGASFRSITEYFGELVSGGTIITTRGSFYAPISRNALFFQDDLCYIYNLESDRWGYVVFYASDGSLTGYRPMTGESAALRALVTPTQLKPDLTWLLNLSSGTKAAMKSDGYPGSIVSSTPTALMIGSLEGFGGRKVTLFSGLDLDISAIPGSQNVGSDISPSATELKLDVQVGDAKHDYDLAPNIAFAEQDIASETSQNRFVFQHSGVYARFKIKIPASAGYVELNDYTPLMQENGEL